MNMNPSPQSVPERPGMVKGGEDQALSPLHEKEWLTVNEAVIVFRELGLPRTPEAVRKYCRQEKLGTKMITGAKGEQHIIETKTIKPFVDEQLKVLNGVSRNNPEHASMFRDVPVRSVISRDVPEHAEEDNNNEEDDASDLRTKLEDKDKENDELKQEIRNLEIDKEVRNQMVARLESDRNKIYDMAMEYSRKVGQLEEKVNTLQLAAPKSPGVEDNDQTSGGEENNAQAHQDMGSEVTDANAAERN